MATKRIPVGDFGKEWTVRVSRRPLKDDWGYVHWEKREIVLSKDAEKRGLDRDTLIHELTHKAMPFLSEQCVDVFATELDDALEACGY